MNANRAPAWYEETRLYARRPAMPRYWLVRMYIALSVLTNVLIICSEPHALAHRVVASSGVLGWLCVGALGLLACLALADVVVNDLLPAHINLPVARRWRHLIYMLLALGLVSITGVIVAAIGPTTLLLTFWLDASVSVAIAFFDLFSRHRSPA
jgi:hypothetical protein